MPHPSQRLSTRALNPVILPILKHLKLSSLLLLSISITIPIRLYSPKSSLTSPPRFVTDQRPPVGKVYYLPPGSLITGTLVLVIVGEPMLCLYLFGLNL